jgi:hypothetical protein
MDLIQQDLYHYTEHLKSLDDRRITLEKIPSYVQFRTITQEWRNMALSQLHHMTKDNGAFSPTMFFRAVFLYDYTLSKYARELSESEHTALVTASYMLSYKYECGDMYNLPITRTTAGAEYHIFQTLEFNLIVPNMMLVLRLISWELAHGEERTRTMARILMTCALFDRNYVRYNAIQIASACMIIACKIKGRPTDAIEEFCHFDDMSIFSFLSNAFSRYKGQSILKDIETSRKVHGTLIQLEEYLARA